MAWHVLDFVMAVLVGLGGAALAMLLLLVIVACWRAIFQAARGDHDKKATRSILSSRKDRP